MKKHCRGRVINADKKTRRRFLAPRYPIVRDLPALQTRPPTTAQRLSTILRTRATRAARTRYLRA